MFLSVNYCLESCAWAAGYCAEAYAADINLLGERTRLVRGKITLILNKAIFYYFSFGFSGAIWCRLARVFLIIVCPGFT